MRRCWLIIFFLFSAVSALAQETAEDYFHYKLEQHEPQQLSITTDTLLFFRALHRRSDLYEELSAYHFSSVDYGRRGEHFTARKVMLDGVELRRQNISLLRRLGLSERGYAGVMGMLGGVAPVAGADCFSLSDFIPTSGGNVALSLSGQGYLAGVRASLHALMRRGWSMSLYAAAKGGNDLYIKGVCNNSADLGLRLKRDFDNGASLSLVALSSVGERGLRSGSTAETFTLTGDNLYNPTWGRQAGKVRNSRLRRDAVPFVAMSFDAPIGAATSLNVTFGGDYGRRGYTSLGWYDAMTPRPDNYRNLPSYFADEDVAAVVAEEWRRANERYTQVNWDDLFTQNRRSADGAVYALEERVERIAKTQLSVQMATLLGEKFTLNYGARAWYNSVRYYKLMDDLLGATHLMDIDYFLIDDDTYSNSLQNNLLQPDRAVAAGDRFGYDYALRERGVVANVGFEYHASRWQVAAELLVGRNDIEREGYYEKELYVGDKSLGRSAVSSFSPYMAKALVGYAFSTRHQLNLSAMFSRQTPQARHLFLNPQYNNRVVDNPTMQRDVAAELNYNFRSSHAELVVSLFAVRSADGREVIRAYDDLSATYCDVDINGIGLLRYGVEAALRLYLTQQLQVEVTASAGEYCYVDNPLVSHYSDTDNSIVCNASTSYMSDCHVGGAPHISSTAQLTWFAPRRWILSGAVNYAGGRWVEPSVVRRTERVARQGAASPEIYEQFLSQQRLNDAMTVDASVAHWWYLGRSRLSVSLMVKNLFGVDDIVYGGYEQNRIRHYRSGVQRVYAPQDDIITYAYPRSFYGVVSWKF